MKGRRLLLVFVAALAIPAAIALFLHTPSWNGPGGGPANSGGSDTATTTPDPVGTGTASEAGTATTATVNGAAVREETTLPLPTAGNVSVLSDARAEGAAYITHAYSSVSPFNTDSSLVLLEKSGGVMHVRDLQSRIIKDDLHLAGILPRSDAVWSRTDPHLLYFHDPDGNKIKSYNVATGEVRMLASLERFEKINFGNGEGDISWDGRFIPVLADGRYALIYDIETGAASPAVDTGKYGRVDMLDATSSGKLVFSVIEPAAVWVADPWSGMDGAAVQVLDYIGHSDRARGPDGQDLLVITNSADPTPISGCQNGIVGVDLGTFKETCLQPLDWDLAVHISCNNAGRGWCAVSTYSASGPAEPRPPYHNVILKVDLGGSGTTVLTPTRSSNSEYHRQPRAAISPDGKYVLFASDMEGEYVDAYLLFVP